MSQKSQPKHRFMKKLDSGDYLSLAVWPGKSNPDDEVISVQVRRMEGDWRAIGGRLEGDWRAIGGRLEGDWKTVGRLAVYRTKDGAYSQLPESRGAEKQA